MIDRFVINVSPSAFTTERKNYSGIFGFAIIDMSLEIICAENFYGPNCDQVCVENCTCKPGFKGKFCETIVEDVGDESTEVSPNRSFILTIIEVISLTLLIILVIAVTFIALYFKRKMKKNSVRSRWFVSYPLQTMRNDGSNAGEVDDSNAAITVSEVSI